MKKNNSEDIIELTDFGHARLRTEMYLGSRVPHSQEVLLYNDNLEPYIKELTWVPALNTYLREALDNACDEIISFKSGSSIWITFDSEKFIFSVEDDGRGIPIDYDKEQKVHKATIALSRARAGRNFQSRGDVAGTNGLGIACTNFCSEFFKVEIVRDGKKFIQEFNEGNFTVDNNITIKEPKITPSTAKSGTKITFKPSKYVFEKVPELKDNFILPEEFIKSRVTEIAITNPNVKIFYNGKRITVKPTVEKSIFPNKDLITLEIKEQDFLSNFYIQTDLENEGDFVHTIVNRIPALNGGIHIDVFKKSFYRGLISYLEKESKRRKLVLSIADIQQGILIYNVTNMKAPNFDSQSKTRLINENAGTIIKKFFDDENVFKNIVKKNKQWIEKIYERCAERTNKKDDAEINKLAKKAAKVKVPKLIDANGKDRSKCTIVLGEGDSAIGGLAEARNPETFAGLPLRGKVRNVNELSVKEVLSNTELVDIMNSVGLIIGLKAKRESLRYGKIYIAHDMDPDGANIGALLINFFYTFWPELFDEKDKPFIFIFQTPFLIGEYKKERRYWYAHNYHEYDPIKHKEYKITRAKGLGTLMREDWEYSLKNPELIPIIADENFKETLDLIFNGNRADDRKLWLGNIVNEN